ncbi:hypothetical protein [Amycolatopsis anabasis]|uniref:hypothetical protein n=1 Tax=Amycolatopsis anabasis TaxID=1840409 RepID=UPI001C55226F|nr:hypothetical protein [Amycolatopsis anabasis]
MTPGVAQSFEPGDRVEMVLGPRVDDRGQVVHGVPDLRPDWVWVDFDEFGRQLVPTWKLRHEGQA